MKLTMRAITITAGIVVGLGTFANQPMADTTGAIVQARRETQVTRDDFLQVYTINWENLPKKSWEPRGECAGDWRDLLHYMRFGPGPTHGGPFPKYTPDIVLVQQIDDPDELEYLAAEMTEHLNGRYVGVPHAAYEKTGDIVNTTCTGTDNDELHQGISKTPPNLKYKRPKMKDTQMNAVIYRAGRFKKVDSWGWQSKERIGKGCRDAADGSERSQDRTRNVAVRLEDKIHRPEGRKFRVTAASVHWPSNKSGGGWQCAKANWSEAVEEMDEPADDELRVIGGDFNVSASKKSFFGQLEWRKWYRKANGEIRSNGDVLPESKYEQNDYRDVIFEHCYEPGNNEKYCAEGKNWTFSHSGDARRIDFLFAQADGGRGKIGLPEVHAEHTVTFDEGDCADGHVGDGDEGDCPGDHGKKDLAYSQHRAIRARIHYPFATLSDTFSQLLRGWAWQ